MTEIPCFVQDTTLPELNEKLIIGYGITVIDDARGFLEVGEKSVVICIGPDVPIKETIMDIARPALIIWDEAHAPGTQYDDMSVFTIEMKNFTADIVSHA